VVRASLRLSEEARRIIRKLRELGIDITMPEVNGECLVSIGEFRGKTFTFYFFLGSLSNYIIIKIYKEIKSCYETLISSFGIYYIIKHNEIPNRATLEKKLLLVLFAQASSGQ